MGFFGHDDKPADAAVPASGAPVGDAGAAVPPAPVAGDMGVPAPTDGAPLGGAPMTPPAPVDGGVPGATDVPVVPPAPEAPAPEAPAAPADGTPGVPPVGGQPQ